MQVCLYQMPATREWTTKSRKKSRRVSREEETCCSRAHVKGIYNTKTVRSKTVCNCCTLDVFPQVGMNPQVVFFPNDPEAFCKHLKLLLLKILDFSWIQIRLARLNQDTVNTSSYIFHVKPQRAIRERISKKYKVKFIAIQWCLQNMIQKTYLNDHCH